MKFENIFRKRRMMKNKLLEKTFSVMEAIAASPQPIGLKELSGQLGLNLSTLSRITADLTEAGYIEKSGYRKFEPALGLIRLGQNAVNDSPLPQLLNPLIRAKTKELGVFGAFGGLQQNQVVYLYRSEGADPTTHLGLPYRTRLYNSNIAIVILAISRGAEGALAVFREALSGVPIEQIRISLTGIEHYIAHVLEHGYLLRQDSDEQWNICFPVEFQGRVYGLSLFGGNASERNFDRLLFESSLLTSRIRSALAAL